MNNNTFDQREWGGEGALWPPPSLQRFKGNLQNKYITLLVKHNTCGSAKHVLNTVILDAQLVKVDTFKMGTRDRC